MSPQKRPWLVTGGTGFLGLHLERHLAGRGIPSVLVDLEDAGDATLAPASRVERLDVRAGPAFDRCVSACAPEVVVHAAAKLPRADPHDVWTTTVDGTRNALDAAARAGARAFVFVSSTAVYPLAATDRSEDAAVDGEGTYGKAKVEAERLCRAHAASHPGMRVVTIRPKSFLGPGRLGVFQLLFDWVQEGRRIPMIGDGSNRYQLLDVSDLCTAIETVASHPDVATGSTFNVGAEVFGTVREDVGALCAAAGTGARPMGTPVRPVELTLELLHRPASHRSTRGSSARRRWTPRSPPAASPASASTRWSRTRPASSAPTGRMSPSRDGRAPATRRATANPGTPDCFASCATCSDRSRRRSEPAPRPDPPSNRSQGPPT